MKPVSSWLPELATIVYLAVSGFVEVHVWSPAYSYFLLMGMVGLDLSTAVLLHQRRYSKRMLLILPAYTVVLALAHNFGRHEAGLVWLPQGVIMLIVVIHLRRLIRNFGELRLIEEDVATVMDVRLKKRLEEHAVLLEEQALPEPVASDEAVPA